jgi:3-oxoadipate enol-lactonase
MGYDEVEIAGTEGRQIAYHELGSGEPLFLHHGGDSNKRQYVAFAPLLAEGIRSISYDQRDVGGSFAATEPYTIGDVADDCVQLMDSLGINKAHIMGFSLGGVVALHVGIRHPDRVQTLIAGTAPSSFTEMTDYAKDVISRQPTDRAELMLNALLSPEGQADTDLVVAVRRSLAGDSAAPDSRRMGAVRSHHVDEELAAITAPTLLIYGSDDPLVTPATGRFFANRIPNAELEIVERGRHGLSSEFPVPVAKLVSEFVLSHPVDR